MKLLKWLFGWMWPKNKSGQEKFPQTKSYIWNIWEHTVPGDYILLDWERRRITGHLPGYEPMKEADIFRVRFENGKIAQFYIINVEYLYDPRMHMDMFFADLNALGYVPGVKAVDAESEHKLNNL